MWLTLRCVGGNVVLEEAVDGPLPETEIGLAISAERVAAVGGRLVLEPLSGGGTCARAELPVP